MPIHYRVTRPNNSPPPRRYVAYARVSRKAQRGSLYRQLQKLRNYVQERGGVLIAEFKEVALDREPSGVQRELAVQRAISERAILIVTRADRLTRDEYLCRAWLNRGLLLRSIDYPSANDDHFLLRVRLAFAERTEQLENQEIGRNDAIREGRSIGGDGTSANIRNHRANERATAIKAIISKCPDLIRYHAGGKRPTLESIAGQLMAWGVKPPRGINPRWSAAQVKRELDRGREFGPGEEQSDRKSPFYFLRFPVKARLRELVGEEVFVSEEAFEAWQKRFLLPRKKRKPQSGGKPDNKTVKRIRAPKG